MLTFAGDPTRFEDAVKSEKWRKAMDVEIEAISRNDTWKSIELPENGKIIGVKWAYKTKFNENGEIDQHKTRLVVKGYSQQQGVDYTKVFAPCGKNGSKSFGGGTCSSKRTVHVSIKCKVSIFI
ncbi:uncharacterized protein LOC111472679 [Cucurbita maxima]|uniref:Uncharacterized protein LOC111472679 n=1 Tax=Cucurbita maxima TaxID=3661 RepID=A0A6J1ICY4_CUCMA|nr:uncharacterized protein LOC111472679 [Cucurbita maxima]